MTHGPDDARFTGDPELQAVHHALQEPIEEQPQVEAVEEVRLASALELSMFSPTTRAFVDQLLSSGENPSPELRQRLTRAAARGVEYQRKLSGPLPILLTARREALRMDVGTLASALGLDDTEVFDLESGKLSVRELRPNTLVAWAKAVGAPNNDIVPGLRRTLELTRATAGQRAAGRGASAKLSDSDNRLIEEVIRLLRES